MSLMAGGREVRGSTGAAELHLLYLPDLPGGELTLLLSSFAKMAALQSSRMRHLLCFYTQPLLELLV